MPPAVSISTTSAGLALSTPPSRKVTSAPSVTVLAQRRAVGAGGEVESGVAMPISPVAPNVAGPCTASVLPAPDTFRSPASLLAAPEAPSPYRSVPPVTCAEPPSCPSTTSLPPDTVVLPRKAPLAPARNVVPAIWFRLCARCRVLSNRVANRRYRYG